MGVFILWMYGNKFNGVTYCSFVNRCDVNSSVEMINVDENEIGVCL